MELSCPSMLCCCVMERASELKSEHSQVVLSSKICASLSQSHGIAQ